MNSMNPSKTTDPGPIYFRHLSEEELLPYFQSQFPGNPEGCGPFSIAMAANLCNRNQPGSKYLGAKVKTILEHKGLKLRGFGMPTWLGYGRALGNFARGRVVHKNKACIDDLELAISNNQIVVVALAWQTTWQILRDIRHATVGHYMVAVGFDKPGGQIIFLNPGLESKEGSSHLYSMTFQEFSTYWNDKSNLFVQRGSMWTISPTNG